MAAAACKPLLVGWGKEVRPYFKEQSLFNDLGLLFPAGLPHESYKWSLRHSKSAVHKFRNRLRYTFTSRIDDLHQSIRIFWCEALGLMDLPLRYEFLPLRWVNDRFYFEILFCQIHLYEDEDFHYTQGKVYLPL